MKNLTSKKLLTGIIIFLIFVIKVLILILRMKWDFFPERRLWVFFTFFQISTNFFEANNFFFAFQKIQIHFFPFQFFQNEIHNFHKLFFCFFRFHEKIFNFPFKTFQQNQKNELRIQHVCSFQSFPLPIKFAHKHQKLLQEKFFMKNDFIMFNFPFHHLFSKIIKSLIFPQKICGERKHNKLVSFFIFHHFL